MSRQLSDRRKTKELKVLELHDRGYSYRMIAKEVHLSLREVTKYIQTISNKRKSQSSTSINDEIVLEYRVNLLRSEARGLELERQSLKDELAELHAQKIQIQNQLRAKQSELHALRRNLEYERFAREILKDITH
jgi:predicted  nucleic acid-binding Zn-ribbon protein